MAVKSIFIFVYLLMSISYADNAQSQSVNTQQFVYCPKVESLVRDDVSGKWSAPGGWFSMKYSFAKQVNEYLGASYRGNDIGRIACYYISNETGDERITLKNTKLTQLPSLDVWKNSEQDKKIKVCNADTNVSCPFIVFQESQQIESLEDAILGMPK